jgi:iron complex transport system permease protein
MDWKRFTASSIRICPNNWSIFLRPYLICLALLVTALVFSVAAGAIAVPPLQLLERVIERLTGWALLTDWPQAYEVIVFRIRLPHAVLALLTGAALAGSGASYQALFRNPLADPYLIGVASGAGLGAVLAMTVRESAVLQQGSFWTSLYAVPLSAFLGALLTVGIVYVLASLRGVESTTTLILAGIAVSSFATALTSFLMLRSQGELYRSLAWLLGGASMSGWAPVVAALPYIVLGLGALLVSGHAMNVLQFGDEQAAQLGISVPRLKGLIILAASLATAAAVSFSGIIGFIGLIVPHLVRLVWGPDYRHLVALSTLGGAAALLVADLLARLLLAPQELPVGIITALTGAPFFLWVLLRTARRT